MRIVIAGGGTGGHVIPAIAIAEELRDRHGAEVLFMGTARGIETRLVPAAGFPLELVKVGALNQVSWRTRAKTALALPLAILGATRILREFGAAVVIGVGGYASGPGMAAAILTGRPTLAVEPNLVPGFANRLVARWTKNAAVHFEQTGKYFPRYQVTGVPVRSAFFGIAPRAEDAEPVLLAFGGSQGARAINTAMAGALPQLLAAMPDLRIIWQTGERGFDPAVAALSRLSENDAGRVEIARFLHDMPERFAAANLIVCRSGASAVAEIAAAGKAAIFIPLPTAADDHQTRNAEALVEAGAATLIVEKSLTPEVLATSIVSLLGDRRGLGQMANSARAMAHPNAAAEIAAMAVELIQPRLR